MLLKKILILIFSLFFIIIIAEIGIIFYYSFSHSQVIPSQSQNNSNQAQNTSQIVLSQDNNNFSFKNIASKYLVPYVVRLGEDLDNNLIYPENIVLETEHTGIIEKINFAEGKIDNFNYIFYIELISKITKKKTRFYFNNRELEIIKVEQKNPLRKMSIKELKKGDLIKLKMKSYLFYPLDKNSISLEIIKID